jgi:two-component system LytT family sensor kinase
MQRQWKIFITKSPLHFAMLPILRNICDCKFISLYMRKLNISTIVAHIIGCLIFLSFPLLFIANQPDSSNVFSVFFSSGYLIFFLTYLSVFYLNTYFLIPAFYLHKKFAAYFLIVILLGFIIFLIKPFDQLISQQHRPFRNQTEQSHAPPESRQPPVFEPSMQDDHRRTPPPRIDPTSFFLFIMVIVLGLAIKTTNQLQATEKRAANAEAEKANAELSFLKAQVNPHFLFNTLNNIYSLAITKNESTAVCIMKLSNIMRYVTDDASENYVPLENEINCITDYIDLQKLRLGENAAIDFETTGDTENKKIAPLLLMSFVENIFKYGVSKREPSKIAIKIFSEKMSISFYCRNKIFTPSVDEKRTGIGIANSRKRLEYLYPGKHLLNIDHKDGYYTVQLILKL